MQQLTYAAGDAQSHRVFEVRLENYRDPLQRDIVFVKDVFSPVPFLRPCTEFLVGGT